MLCRLLAQFGGILALGVADVVPHLDFLRGREIHLGAETEFLVGREVLVPVLLEQRVIREVVAAPVLDGVAVFLWEFRSLDLPHLILRAACWYSSAYPDR